MIGIYKISNKQNGKYYVGSSHNIEKRFNQHQRTLELGCHHNEHLQRAWAKYGSSSFIFEVVEECTPEVLHSREQHYLDNNVGGYNIGKSSCGGDNITEHPNREAIVEKISIANRERIASMTEEERQQRFSKPMEQNANWRGGTTYSYCDCGVRKKPTAKTCSKCRDRSGVNNPFFGKTHTEQTRQVLREHAANRTTKPSNSKKVQVGDTVYETASEAARAYNITRGLVNYRCNSDKYDWIFI